MKEFIRPAIVSPPLSPPVHSESQPQTPSLLAVVEQAHKTAADEQANKLEDLLSNGIDDLIDFTNETQSLSIQELAINNRGLQDLDGLRGLLMPQQTLPDTADKTESDLPGKLAVVDENERKHLQSPRLVSQSQTVGPSILSIDGPHQKDANMSKPETADPSQIILQSTALFLGRENVHVQSMKSGYDFELSPTTTATPSMFSHASTLSSVSGSSWHVITDAELRQRELSTPTLPSQSSPAPQPIRPPIERSCSSESFEQRSFSSPHMASYPASSPTIFEDAEFDSPVVSRVAFVDKVTAPALESSPKSKPEDMIHQLDVTTELSLQGINKPDGEGFPWIVRAGLDGDETQIRRLILSGADLKVVHAITKRDVLGEASLHGHIIIVDLLINEGCSTNNADAESYTALHHACHKGHLAIVKSLVAAKSDLEASGPQGKTPLHLAAQVPHKNVVMLLLQRNANVNARDDNSQTPLHISAAQGNVEMCSYLLENGAQIDNRDFKSKTALQLACELGHYDTAEVMLKCSSLRTTDLTFLAAFFTAVEHGNVRIAESFLSRGLDLQKLNKFDIYKPVTSAAKSGSLAMLELMIRVNCSVKARDDNEWNALHFAAQYGHWRLIEPLVANDVSVKAATRMKDSPLILAVKGGHFTATEILLRCKGISVTVEDGQAEQPIHHATRAGSFDMFNLLISNGAKIAVENVFGWHPIHIAVAYGHITLVSRLIEQSAKIEEKLGASIVKKNQTHKMVEDGYWAEARWPYPGSRPLHLACEYGHYQTASNLISKGAKLEASCSEGWRPLHHAAFNGSSALVELLLNANCYPWAETEEGHTAQTLQFRTAGSPITQEEKDKVHLLLQEAMDKTTKQPVAKGFKGGLKKSRTVEEKHKLIRAATFSMEIAAKSPEQSTEIHRPHPTQPPMPHSNTYPSALPSIHYPAQTTQPSQSLPIERPVSSGSNHPATTASEPKVETAIQIASPTASLINLPFTGPNDSTLGKTPSHNVIALGSTTTTALQHSIGPMPGLPDLSLNLMKNKFNLKRASTFGVGISKQGLGKVSSGLGSSKQGIEKMSSFSLDVSKQGIEKMSNGLGSSKQGIEKMSSFSLDVSKQGYKKVSSYGQNVSKQGLEKMKKINYGQNVSKQGMEKMKKLSLRKDKKLLKQDAAGDTSAKHPARQPSGTSVNTATSAPPHPPDFSQGSGSLQSPGQSNGGDQGGTGDTSSLNPQSDEDVPYNSDGAESIGGFSLGGFDTYDTSGTDGGGFGGGFGGEDFGGDGC